MGEKRHRSKSKSKKQGKDRREAVAEDETSSASAVLGEVSDWRQAESKGRRNDKAARRRRAAARKETSTGADGSEGYGRGWEEDVNVVPVFDPAGRRSRRRDSSTSSTTGRKARRKSAATTGKLGRTAGKHAVDSRHDAAMAAAAGKDHVGALEAEWDDGNPFTDDEVAEARNDQGIPPTYAAAVRAARRNRRRAARDAEAGVDAAAAAVGPSEDPEAEAKRQAHARRLRVLQETERMLTANMPPAPEELRRLPMAAPMRVQRDKNGIVIDAAAGLSQTEINRQAALVRAEIERTKQWATAQLLREEYQVRRLISANRQLAALFRDNEPLPGVLAAMREDIADAADSEEALKFKIHSVLAEQEGLDTDLASAFHQIADLEQQAQRATVAREELRLAVYSTEESLELRRLAATLPLEEMPPEIGECVRMEGALETTTTVTNERVQHMLAAREAAEASKALAAELDAEISRARTKSRSEDPLARKGAFDPELPLQAQLRHVKAIDINRERLLNFLLARSESTHEMLQSSLNAVEAYLEANHLIPRRKVITTIRRHRRQETRPLHSPPPPPPRPPQPGYVYPAPSPAPPQPPRPPRPPVFAPSLSYYPPQPSHLPGPEAPGPAQITSITYIYPDGHETTTPPEQYLRKHPELHMSPDHIVHPQPGAAAMYSAASPVPVVSSTPASPGLSYYASPGGYSQSSMSAGALSPDDAARHHRLQQLEAAKQRFHQATPEQLRARREMMEAQTAELQRQLRSHFSAHGGATHSALSSPASSRASSPAAVQAQQAQLLEQLRHRQAVFNQQLVASGASPVHTQTGYNDDDDAESLISSDSASIDSLAIESTLANLDAISAAIESHLAQPRTASSTTTTDRFSSTTTTTTRAPAVSDLAACHAAHQANRMIQRLEYDPEANTVGMEIGDGLGGQSVALTLVMADGYPDEPCSLLDGGSMSLVSGPLTTIVDETCAMVAKRLGVPYVGHVTRASTVDSILSLYSDSECVLELSYSSSDDEEDLHPMAVSSRAISGHKLLARDVAIFESLHGKGRADFTALRGLDSGTLTLQWWPPLTRMTGKAWGVDMSTPVLIEFDLVPTSYLFSRDPPRVRVSQDSDKPFLLAFQLRNILNSFLGKIWSELSTRLKHCHLDGAIPCEDAGKGKDTIDDVAGTSSMATSATSTTSAALTAPASDNHSLAHMQLLQVAVALTDMGFPLEAAIAALNIAATMEEATELLLTRGESLLDDPPGGPIPGSYAHMLSIAHGETLSGRADEESQASPAAKTASPHSGAIFAGDDGLGALDVENMVDYDHGLPSLIVSYLNARTPHLNSVCIICDQPHLFASGLMLKPSVCSRTICSFAFQDLGVAADAAAELALGTAIIDLLVCFAVAAATDAQAELIFDPFPRLYDPNDRQVVVLDPDNKDFTILREILNSFPPVAEMASVSSAQQLQDRLNEANRFAYPLLAWLISSNRSHIVLLPPEQRLQIKTPFQYLMLSSAPEKEAVFQELKVKHGSKFAWHGSPTQNWHSISRRGLVSASGTKLQRHGSAHGSGIYLSTTLSYSMGYSTKNSRFTGRGTRVAATTADADEYEARFLDPENMICVALCELIDTSEVRKSNNIWVVPNADHVAVRFLFVFSHAKSIEYEKRNSTDSSFHAEVCDILAAQMSG
ncbi:polymerase 8 [Thecamonas trahens ATCC 50062]|uniref:Polymerase 8 n=1 Tax=Thecamonas trahens ATCC 50062 TaxID=461836 RepID=A0A0L0DXR5_THETB|nr:polymerase 8 [Thecamonas trahens ATCC 50062]KNC56323.1 polymerase 8 [Thecamonas trahens ATCC 50062]|eukprot:XP_013760840.1 polymerase 8 [Thecamonas trahens ATCC 50062]